MHLVLFIIGVAVLCSAHCHGFLKWVSFLSEFPYVGALTAAYLWIRPDIWLSTKKISKKDSVNFISRQADCLIAISLLFLVAAAQFFSPTQDKAGRCMFLGSLLIILPISHCVARLLEKLLQKFHNPKTGNI